MCRLAGLGGVGLRLMVGGLGFREFLKGVFSKVVGDEICGIGICL